MSLYNKDLFVIPFHPYPTKPVHMPDPVHHQYLNLYAYPIYIDKD